MADQESAWDKLLQIKTVGRDESNADQYHHPYEPTPYCVLERLAGSGLIGSDDVVLDYGCGRGRVGFFLSYRTKAKTIGIEYDDRIYCNALENQKTAPSKARAEFVLTNAEAYEVPAEVNRCYFFNPFSAQILRKVMARIIESYYEHPRELFLFFYYLGLITAVIAYYAIHEGAHFLYALFTGVFRRINFMGLGVQIDIYTEQLTQSQLSIFCFAGSVATLAFAYVLVALAGKIGQVSSKVFKACCYYITIALLLIDPLYLSLLCSFFGGGDMNGIALLIPESAARMIYGVIGLANAIVLLKIVLPTYQLAFTEP